MFDVLPDYICIYISTCVYENMYILTIFGCGFLLDDLVEEAESDRRYSCIIQLVLIPAVGASPTWNTKYFFMPTLLLLVLETTGSSIPVGFQYPLPVTLFCVLLL